MAQNTKFTNALRPTVQRLLKLAGAQTTWLVLALLFDLLRAVIVVLTAVFLRTLFDAALAAKADMFWLSVWILLGLTAPSALLSYLRTQCIGWFSERTLAKLRRAIAARSTVLPVGYLEERHTGDMLSVLNADLDKVKALLANHLPDFFAQIARGIGALGYILSINWALTLISILLTPAIFFVINLLTQPIAKRSQEMQDEIGRVNGIAQDSLAGAMVVKSFNLQEILEQRFHQANFMTVLKGRAISRLWSLVTGVGLSLSITPFIIAFGFGGYLVINKMITFGSLFAFIDLLNYVVDPLGNIPRIIAGISESAGAAQRVFQLLDNPTERQDGAITQPKVDIPLAIQFDNVSFAYAEDKPVLKNVHLSIPKGQTIAIVGPSGGGKSTVLKLILGFYSKPDEQILLFGDRLKDWRLVAARNQMAFMAQDTYLFPVSIGENIRCGKLGASQEEIERAARSANIHDFIMSLPDGYDTEVGEWGARLSGGQKQRLSLARAILKDTPILLLDEPTSALDAESEALIQEALGRFKKAGTPQAHTVVVVAHRLSTIKNANRVVVLDNGEIVDEGTHDELIARGGLYLDLYRRQFELEKPAQPPGIKP